MQQVRTRMQPDVPVDVSDDEYEVLRAGGLLADDPAPATVTVTAKTNAPAQPSGTPSTTAPGAPAPAADTTTTKKG